MVQEGLPGAGHRVTSFVSLKVDVDTYLGTREGVPRLLDLFAKHGIRATFFVTLGPDRSGLAVRRIFRRGFVAKMLRTSAVRMYGWRTLVYGTLLPAPRIGERCIGALAAIRSAGHELGLHTWDHNEWQDRVFDLPPETVREINDRGRAAYKDLFGEWPACQAAPAWRCTEASLAFHDEAGLWYASDTRGRRPFFPTANGRRFSTLQVPTTLPTLDEAWGTLGQGEDLKKRYLAWMREKNGPQVLGIHAEGEGGSHLEWFASLLTQARSEGVRFRTVRELAEEALADRGSIPDCEVVRVSIPGRAGVVCAPAGLLPKGATP